MDLDYFEFYKRIGDIRVYKFTANGISNFNRIESIDS